MVLGGKGLRLRHIKFKRTTKTTRDEFFVREITPGRRQSKTLLLSTNVDQKSLETEFSIAICRPTGAKLQSKTLLLAIFDLRFFDCQEHF